MVTTEEIKNGEIFARENENGHYDILDTESGETVTRIDANIYPVNSAICSRYEHPEGIELTEKDVKSLNIEIE